MASGREVSLSLRLCTDVKADAYYKLLNPIDGQHSSRSQHAKDLHLSIFLVTFHF